MSNVEELPMYRPKFRCNECGEYFEGSHPGTTVPNKHVSMMGGEIKCKHSGKDPVDGTLTFGIKDWAEWTNQPTLKYASVKDGKITFD